MLQAAALFSISWTCLVLNTLWQSAELSLHSLLEGSHGNSYFQSCDLALSAAMWVSLQQITSWDTSLPLLPWNLSSAALSSVKKEKYHYLLLYIHQNALRLRRLWSAMEHVEQIACTGDKAGRSFVLFCLKSHHSSHIES